MTVRSALLLAVALALAPTAAFAQAPIPYGEPINLDKARKLIAAAEAEATKQKWPVAIVVVDGSGHLVAMIKMDNTQLGSIEVALEKAKCAALFRRPTKVFEDGLVSGGANLRALKAPGVLPIEGGIPIVHDSKVIGAIGVSGVKANEDGIVAQAGLDALKAKP